MDRIKPEVGMGATMCLWSDRHAYTIIAVSKNRHKITIQRDKATRIDKNGMSDCQTYEYERNPEGEIETATLRKDGAYRITNSRILVGVGHRNEHFDFSF